MSKFNSGKASILAIFVTLVASAFLLGRSVTSMSAESEGKVYVCKYVGRPGVDEVLQTGQNPIEVSVNAVHGATVGSYFNDAQGRSYVLATAPQNPVPTCSQNPLPPPTPTCSGDIPSTLLVDATRTITNSPDSGEAGNYWAKDNFTQRMRIWEVGQGDLHLYCGQTDDNGTFDTIAGEKSPGNSAILNGSEDGTFYGSTRVQISGAFNPVWGTFTNVGLFNFDIPAEKIGYSTNPNWIDKYFPESTFSWISWGWHYKSCGHGAWNNTNTGNSGDIVPGPTDEVCQTPTPTPTPSNFVFPSCSSYIGINGNPHYDFGNPHQIVGEEGKRYGRDDVYALENGNYLQCFCPDGGNNGIQTNWLRTNDPIIGWFFENGLQWNLGNYNYAAQNLDFSCNRGTTATPVPHVDDGGDGLGCAVNDCSGNARGPEVLGTGTGGQILGASTMAGAGSFAEYANLVIMIVGGTLSFLGAKSLKKA